MGVGHLLAENSRAVCGNDVWHIAGKESRSAGDRRPARVRGPAQEGLPGRKRAGRRMLGSGTQLRSPCTPSLGTGRPVLVESPHLLCNHRTDT